ncbi:UPF0235 protein [Methylopila turkensis]|uniref:UPF0235 protein GCM10008174_34020 n=1 Tax=Methylopila turkensis TaxID=1437816 RepID=A0A9W6JQ11_9HYPH|nr:UPF0235 protein [Methylopila turkensis]
MRLTPRGGRDAIDGVEVRADGEPALAARVQAAPEKGRANEALRDLIADACGVARSAVRLVAGAAGRLKTIEIAGDPGEIADRLARAAGEADARGAPDQAAGTVSPSRPSRARSPR